MTSHRWILVAIVVVLMMGVSSAAADATQAQAPCSDPDSTAVNSGIPCTNPAVIGEFPTKQIADLARTAGVNGRMVVRVSIDANGVVLAAVLEKPCGNAELEKAVASLLSPLAFRPATIRGEGVPAVLRMHVLVV